MKPKKNKFTARTQQTSEIRKEFYKRLLWICLGIIPTLLVSGEKGPARFIGVAGVIFLMYQFMSIIPKTKLIADDFFPPKTYKETKTKPLDKFIYYFAMTLFLSGIIFEIFEIRVIDNTINGVAFFWKSAFAGIGMATLLTIILLLTKSTIYDESSRRFSVHFGLFMGFFLFVPAMASFINHYYADQTTDCKTYQVVKKSPGRKRNESSWLFIKLANNAEERFEVSREFYDSVTEGGQVKLCTKRGIFGYEFVEEFKTIYE